MSKTVDFNSENYRIVEEPKKPISMNPKKFGMWLFMASVLMLFISLTSAYIVRQAEGNWVFFDLPNLFLISSIVIAASSVTMQLGFWAAKKDNLERVKIMVGLTTILGLAFLVIQYMGWKALVANSVYLVGNPSGSFLYVITGLHAAHIISAVVYLLIVLNAAFRLRIHSKNMVQMEMCTTYWHFLGVLWLYLFVFLTLLR
jgi:cytochrome c oxidase subunit 3